MGTKGYMKHMERVNKGLEYMYPSRGKGTSYTQGYRDGKIGRLPSMTNKEYYEGYEKGRGIHDKLERLYSE